MALIKYIMKKRIDTLVTQPFKDFISPINEIGETGQLGGFLLLNAIFISLLLSNIPLNGEGYIGFWDKPVSSFLPNVSTKNIINEGLMVVFFFLIGLEIKKELIQGELQTLKQATLPLLAALGSVLMPMMIFMIFNINTPTAKGWAIPTTTDIAFSLGVLTFMGSKVSLKLKIFLIALAIIDDLFAVLTITFFYSNTLNWLYLGITLTGIAGIWLLNKVNTKYIYCYIVIGLVIWWSLPKAGIHPTVAGIITALSIPINQLMNFEHAMQKSVNYLIVPLFALANVAVPIDFEGWEIFQQPHMLGIMFGLLLGKPLGILLATWLGVRLGIAHLPEKVKWPQILGIGVIAGTSFTMSIFITELSLGDVVLKNMAKMAVLLTSAGASIIGLIILAKSEALSHLADFSFRKLVKNNL